MERSDPDDPEAPGLEEIHRFGPGVRPVVVEAAQPPPEPQVVSQTWLYATVAPLTVSINMPIAQL